MSALAHVTAGDIAKASLINDMMPVISAISVDTTIGDDTGYIIYACTAGSDGIKVTLPTAADNTNRCYEFIKVDDTTSVIMIDGEGAETISGLTHIFLTYQYQRVKIICDGSNWYVSEGKQIYKTGMISRSDWQNVHLGTIALDYDNLSGTFQVGEIITGGTSSDTGVIIADDGSTLDLMMCTSGGVFQNNEEISGAWSSATADVNEATGSAKNLDCNFKHKLAVDCFLYTVRLLISTDGTYNNAYEPKSFSFDKAASADLIQGFTMYQVNANQFRVQTGEDGINVVEADGTRVRLDTEDYFYEIICKREF